MEITVFTRYGGYIPPIPLSVATQMNIHAGDRLNDEQVTQMIKLVGARAVKHPRKRIRGFRPIPTKQ